MIKKVNRIRKQTEFQEIILSKQIEKNKEYIIYYRFSDNDKCRVGVSVSKKIGNAVIRNKTKRQVRHIMHEIIKDYANLDLIVIVRLGYKNNDFSKNYLAMSEIMKKIWRKKNEKNKKNI